MKRLVLSVLIGAVVLGTSGCFVLLAGVAGGAGVAVWMSNKLGQDVNSSLEKCVRASKGALTGLNLPLNKETIEPDLVQLRSKYDNGDEIWIDLHRISPERCRVEVRVGVPGDKVSTRKVFDAIIKRL